MIPTLSTNNNNELAGKHCGGSCRSPCFTCCKWVQYNPLFQSRSCIPQPISSNFFPVLRSTPKINLSSIQHCFEWRSEMMRTPPVPKNVPPRFRTCKCVESYKESIVFSNIHFQLRTCWMISMPRSRLAMHNSILDGTPACCIWELCFFLQRMHYGQLHVYDT